MIRTLIIEDEKAAYTNLVRFLNLIEPEIEIIHWLKSVDQSILWLKENPSPDLVFLDIQLSDGNSFDIFKSVALDCPVIFTTAYDEYAIDAFSLHSIDYLLKPISRAKLQKAVDKFKSIHKNKDHQLEQIKAMMSGFQNTESYKDRFLVKKGDQLISIPTDKVAYFYVDEITLVVTTDGKRFSIHHTLENLEKELDPKTFFRLNRKVIANFKSIDKIIRLSDSKLKIQLSPKHNFEIFVSKEKASSFKNWLG